MKFWFLAGLALSLVLAPQVPATPPIPTAPVVAQGSAAPAAPTARLGAYQCARVHNFLAAYSLIGVWSVVLVLLLGVHYRNSHRNHSAKPAPGLRL